MILDNYEEFELDGKKYRLKYNNRAVIRAEKEMSVKIYQIVDNLKKDILPDYNDILILFKYGLIEGTPDPAGWTDESVGDIFDQAVYEYAFAQVLALCIKALRTAGVLEIKPKKILAALKA